MPAAVFPYGILLAIGCLYNHALMARLFDSYIFPLFRCLLGLWLIGLVCAVLVYARLRAAGRSQKEHL